MKRLARLALLAWPGIGCDDRVPIHCPGSRPALDNCLVGRNFAECGGTGGPLFACVDAYPNDCRWFVAGCVARGYVASSCPADDLCCHDDFPCTEGELGAGDLPALAAGGTLFGNGTLPWNRTDHMVVAVAVVPELPVQNNQFTCTGDFGSGADPSYSNLCASSGSVALNRLDASGPMHGTIDLVFESGATLAGSFSIDGPRRARTRVRARVRWGILRR